MPRKVPPIFALFAGLCGCSTSPVVSTGPQTYSLSATRCGMCEPVSAYVTEEASKYCQSQSKHLVVQNINTSGNQPPFPGSATINFSCLSEDARTTYQVVSEECAKDYQNPALDPIRQKIELTRAVPDTPPPFAMAANDGYPTEVERQAIARWASMRDACIARGRAVPRVPPSATPLQATFIEQDAAFADETTGKVSGLIVALYQGKLTYGEFAQKRYEFGRDGAAAEREFRQASLIADQQRAMQAKQLAQQEFQTKVAAWSAYLQAVNSRPAQTNIRMEQNVTVH